MTLEQLRPTKVGLKILGWRMFYAFLAAGLTGLLGALGANGAGAVELSRVDVVLLGGFGAGAGAALTVLQNYVVAKRDAS